MGILPDMSGDTSNPFTARRTREVQRYHRATPCDFHRPKPCSCKHSSCMHELRWAGGRVSSRAGPNIILAARASYGFDRERCADPVVYRDPCIRDLYARKLHGLLSLTIAPPLKHLCCRVLQPTRRPGPSTLQRVHNPPKPPVISQEHTNLRQLDIAHVTCWLALLLASLQSPLTRHELLDGRLDVAAHCRRTTSRTDSRERGVAARRRGVRPPRK